tara:strand:+ start:74 stop:541 length:468 start_codon:yes stop_codon:yes gene_type:complete
MSEEYHLNINSQFKKIYIKADNSTDIGLDIQKGQMSLGGNIIPKTDNTYNIGTSEYQIKDLYISGTWKGGIIPLAKTEAKVVTINDIPAVNGNVTVTDVSGTLTGQDTVKYDGGIEIGNSNHEASNGTIRFRNNQFELKVNGDWYAVILGPKIDI